MRMQASMTRKLPWIAVAAVLLVGAALAGLTRMSAASRAVQPADVDLAEGAALYAEHCAACHGIRLQGEPDWETPGPDGRLPAPPHDDTGHTWHHGDATLFAYTRLGGEAALAARGVEFASGMPGFGDVLSDREIWNVLAFIKSTWPQRIQDIQATRTQAEQMHGDE